MRPILVIATIGLALAIIAEATLSFLGARHTPTTPALGTLIRSAMVFVFWPLVDHIFPAISLVILVFAVNMGDWMRVHSIQSCDDALLDIKGLMSASQHGVERPMPFEMSLFPEAG